MSNCEIVSLCEPEDLEIIDILQIKLNDGIEFGDNENPFNVLNQRITSLLKEELKSDYLRTVTESFSPELLKKTKANKISSECFCGAKISILMAIISQPDSETAIEYAKQSISYLRDLGIFNCRATKFEEEFFMGLNFTDRNIINSDGLAVN